MSARLDLPPVAEHRAGGRTLGMRLLSAQAVVLVASVVTAGLVALLVGPPIFHEHLLRAGGSMAGSEMQHIEEAFQDASLISLGIALAVALGCALVVTWYVTSRIQRPLQVLTHAAREMGRGHHAVRAEVSDARPELISLAAAFNAMAIRLETTEDTRRRLLSDLAHEMRTPVATISAYLDGLDDGVVAWDRDASRVIRAQTERLARLCDDIGEVSRAEEGRMNLHRAVQPVSDLVRAAAHSAQAAYDAKGVTLATQVDGQGLVVDVDSQRIAQVLANLLTNALRHTPPGGTVSLTAKEHADEVCLLVSDTGEGMSQDQLAHAFERFYRGDSARSRDTRGSGIGLTIAKALVDAHGGSLSASSPGLGNGSTFTVTLPRAARLTPRRSAQWEEPAHREDADASEPPR